MENAAPAPRTADSTTAAGGPFRLVDQSGRTVDQGVLKGKWSAVFFGFTYCPDACPTTLFALGQAEKLLGDRGKRIRDVRDGPDGALWVLTDEDDGEVLRIVPAQ